MPKISLPCEAIVKGDSKVQAISAASILAKAARDAELYELDKIYPQYGFAQHKGYPTAAHLAALAAHGICVEHRLSYAPVKALLVQILQGVLVKRNTPNVKYFIRRNTQAIAPYELAAHGIFPEHRLSYAPVKAISPSSHLWQLLLDSAVELLEFASGVAQITPHLAVLIPLLILHQRAWQVEL